MNIVFGEGPRECKVCFIGEAPGATEAKLGRPFVGNSGDLFTNMMHGAGILRADSYITNVIKQRPPGNDIKHYIDLRKKVPIISDQARVFLEMLKDELSKVNANVFVAVGNTALWALTGKKGITKWRGSILESTLFPGQKVIPILHPASVYRQYLNSHYIRHDLVRIEKQSHSPDIPVDHRNYIVLPTYDEAISYLEQCRRANLVAFDIETGYGQEVSCIAFAHTPGEAMSIPFMHKGREYFTSKQEAEVWVMIAKILESDNACIAHNTPFDTDFLFKRYGIRSRNLDDTMIAQRVNFPDFPASLAFLTSWYTDLPYYKDDGKATFKSGATRNTSEEAFYVYNAKDAAILLEIFPQQVEELTRLNNVTGYEQRRRLLQPILYMSARGVAMDTLELAKKSQEAGYVSHKYTQELREVTQLSDLNPASPAQLANYFYNIKEVKPITSKVTGNPTTDRDALKKLSKHPDPDVKTAARLIQLIRRADKMDSTYYTITLDEDERLRCSFNPVGTDSDRMSSKKTIWGTGMNMQNQPKEMKKCMLVDHGYVGFGIDLAQAENRVVAYYAPDRNMIHAFENGIDLHLQTAAMLFDVSYDAVTYDDSNPDHWVELGDGTHAMRYWGKRANHALNYKMGAGRAADLWDCTFSEAQWIIDRYHKIYPGVRKMWLKIEHELRSNSFILTSLLNRKRTFLGQPGELLYKSAYSFIPQSTVAGKINRDGLVYIYYNQQLFDPVEILMQVHDSIEIQIPLSEGWEYIASSLLLIKQALESPIIADDREFSIPADIQMLPYNLGEGPEFKGGYNWDLSWNDPVVFAKVLNDAYNTFSIKTHAA